MATIKAFEKFKPIRNKLRKYLPDTIIALAISKLHELKDFPIEKIKFYPPWCLLLLIKWTVLHGDFGDYRLPKAEPKDLDRFMNMIRDLFEGLQFPDPFLFIKNVAFQQLWFQRKVNSADLGRQIALFEELPTNDYIRKAFFQKTNIGLQDFLA